MTVAPDETGGEAAIVTGLDAGIAPYVQALREYGIETFESCQGGEGHAYAEPTIRFHGDSSEGYRALAAALQRQLPVVSLRRAWQVIDLAPTGPHWELTFYRIASPEEPRP